MTKGWQGSVVSVGAESNSASEGGVCASVEESTGVVLSVPSGDVVASELSTAASEPTVADFSAFVPQANAVEIPTRATKALDVQNASSLDLCAIGSRIQGIVPALPIRGEGRRERGNFSPIRWSKPVTYEPGDAFALRNAAALRPHRPDDRGDARAAASPGAQGSTHRPGYGRANPRGAGRQAPHERDSRPGREVDVCRAGERAVQVQAPRADP